MNAGRRPHSLNSLIPWTASFLGRPHSIMNVGRRPHSLDGLIPWTASFYYERWTLDGGLIPWTASFYSERWTMASFYCERWTAAPWTAGGLIPWTAASFYSERWTEVHWTASFLGWRSRSILNAGRRSLGRPHSLDGGLILF